MSYKGSTWKIKTKGKKFEKIKNIFKKNRRN